MKVAYGIRNIDEDFKNCIVAIGVFDGVHIGHQKIIHKTKMRSESLSSSGLIITFDTHPEKLLSSVGDSPVLTTLEHKLELFSRYCVSRCLVLKAGKEIFNTPAEEFIIDILYNKLKVKEVVVGEDFTFGKKGAGDVNLLKQLSRKYNFTVIPVKLERIDRDIVSSSLIRDFVKSSQLKSASKALGRNFSILGKLKQDVFLTKKLGLLFFNLDYAQEVLPGEGFYSIKIEYSRKIFAGMALIGTNNVIINSGKMDILSHGKIPVVSIYMPDFSRKIKSSLIEVQFIKLLDERMMFDNTEHFKFYIKKMIKS